MQAETQTQLPGEIKKVEYYDWTGSDLDALIHLKSVGIDEINGDGYLSPPFWPYEVDAKTNAAIDYLCYEWDYCYGERRFKLYNKFFTREQLMDLQDTITSMLYPYNSD